MGIRKFNSLNTRTGAVTAALVCVICAAIAFGKEQNQAKKDVTGRVSVPCFVQKDIDVTTNLDPPDVTLCPGGRIYWSSTTVGDSFHVQFDTGGSPFTESGFDSTYQCGCR